MVARWRRMDLQSILPSADSALHLSSGEYWSGVPMNRHKKLPCPDKRLCKPNLTFTAKLSAKSKLFILLTTQNGRRVTIFVQWVGRKIRENFKSRKFCCTKHSLIKQWRRSFSTQVHLDISRQEEAALISTIEGQFVFFPVLMCLALIFLFYLQTWHLLSWMGKGRSTSE